jgi:hypothetical protein
MYPFGHPQSAEHEQMSLIDAFHRRDNTPDIKPGDCYRRAHGRGLWETVTVLDLRNDALGIPHVRFCVRFERRASEQSETTFRMLALGAFRTAYRERLA